MKPFPAKARLKHLIRSLLRHLPEQVGCLLKAEHFADDILEVNRLQDPDYLQAAIRATGNEEARRLVELLEERWARIGNISPDPAVAIIGPEEVWISGGTREVVLEIATLNLDDHWEAQWLGGIQVSEDTRSAVLQVDAVTGNSPVRYEISVRVTGRCQGRRCIQSTHHLIRARRPVLEISADRRRLQLSDQSGAPGKGVTVDLDGNRYVTAGNGLVQLIEPLPADVSIRLQESICTPVAGGKTASVPDPLPAEKKIILNS